MAGLHEHAGVPAGGLSVRLPDRPCRSQAEAWLLLLVIIPFWTNSLIRTYALILILKANGLISTLLVWLGVTERPVSFMYGDFAVFMGILYTFLPFMVLPLYASIESWTAACLTRRGIWGPTASSHSGTSRSR